MDDVLGPASPPVTMNAEKCLKCRESKNQKRLYDENQRLVRSLLLPGVVFLKTKNAYI